jgi:hypothetical protein
VSDGFLTRALNPKSRVTIGGPRQLKWLQETQPRDRLDLRVVPRERAQDGGVVTRTSSARRPFYFVSEMVL